MRPSGSERGRRRAVHCEAAARAIPQSRRGSVSSCGPRSARSFATVLLSSASSLSIRARSALSAASSEAAGASLSSCAVMVSAARRGQCPTGGASSASRARPAGAATRRRARRRTALRARAGTPRRAELSAKRCRRSVLIRSSPTVCGPRSISAARSATDCAGTSSTRSHVVRVAHHAAAARLDDERQRAQVIDRCLHVGVARPR